MFSVCLPPQSQVLSKVSGIQSFLGVSQSQVLSKVSGPRSFLGVPQSWPWCTLVLARGVLQSSLGGYPQCELGYPPVGDGVPPCLARTGVPPSARNGVPISGQVTLRAVCLVRFLAEGFSCFTNKSSPANTPPPCGSNRDELCAYFVDGRYADWTDFCESYYTCIDKVYFGHNPCSPGMYSKPKMKLSLQIEN